MAKKLTLAQRLGRFWRNLTGSGVRTYDDPHTAGGNDERDQQPGADTGVRNQQRGFNGL
ncbi:hypothetical protein [Agrococcus sp. SCSIO52902]|uniref:hypothetical protein n=1 Tax=Agrococcus sp. SCSIO52902 TaxID=2933290 RepID=UPI001FF685C7|nr:hypothetical protein [Agrococcus sp. SCSIO52902]UOV99946.1 hypothetical protein MU522_08295 [Agrococcus sp. SCSIO52902]